MADTYYNPWTRQNQANRYRDIGSGYFQDVTTGAVGDMHRGQFKPVENAIEDKYERDYGRVRGFNSNLAKYDELANQFRDKTLKDFRVSSEYQGARQTGGVALQTAQTAQRMGLGDSYAAALNNETQAQLRSQVLGMNLDFESKLSQLQNAERYGFLKNEFDVIHRLNAMDYAQELSKDMARFQARLQSDLQSQQIFGELMQVGGFLLGGAFGGPAGAVAGGAAASNWGPGGGRPEY